MTFDITDRIRELGNRDFLVMEIQGKSLILCRHEGECRVFSRICPHAGGDLSKARWENDRLTCTNHGLCYNLRDGSLDLDLIEEDIRENVDEELLQSLKLKFLAVREDAGRYFIEA